MTRYRGQRWPIRRVDRVAGLFLAALAAAFLGSGTACRGAGLLISVPNVTATPGSSGSFDVTITNTTGGTSYNIASDIVELSLTGPSGVNFTGVSIATADTYIYGGNSATNFGSTFSFSTFPGTGFETYDYLYSLGAQTIAPGQTFGLVHVTYSVDPSAMPGTGSLAFGPDTSLIRRDGDQYHRLHCPERVIHDLFRARALEPDPAGGR